MSEYTNNTNYTTTYNILLINGQINKIYHDTHGLIYKNITCSNFTYVRSIALNSCTY